MMLPYDSTSLAVTPDLVTKPVVPSPALPMFQLLWLMFVAVWLVCRLGEGAVCGAETWRPVHCACIG